jgi:putative transposase
MRVHKIKLQPTHEQAVYFARACGTARFAYNWALAEWKRQYESGGKPSEMALRKQLNAIKAEQFPWMAEVTKVAPQQAIKNVGTAFSHFFRRLKSGKGKAGYPQFKRKGLRDSFRADNGPADANSHAIKIVDNIIQLPKCGKVRMRESLRFEGRVLAATVSKMADGWYVAILVETDQGLRATCDLGVVGVDLGITVLATLSDGRHAPAVKAHKAQMHRIRRLSRSLSRKKKGSANRAKAKTKLARLHQRIVNVRTDAMHKLTHRLATEYSTIGIEDLNVSGMLRNRSLARSVADAGFSEFRRQLEYKAAMTGAHVHVVDRFYPSSKTCSACGVIHAMKLSERTMDCDCGNVMDRDLNAAMNLKNMAASYAVTACGEESSGHGRKVKTKLASVKQEAISLDFA